MTDGPAPESMLPLRPVEFRILVSLAEGPRHGYRVLQEAQADTPQAPLGLATLYRALKRLEDHGLTREAPAPPDSTDARRRYFEITGFGRAVAAAEAARLRDLVRQAERIALLDG